MLKTRMVTGFERMSNQWPYKVIQPSDVGTVVDIYFPIAVRCIGLSEITQSMYIHIAGWRGTPLNTYLECDIIKQRQGSIGVSFIMMGYI